MTMQANAEPITARGTAEVPAIEARGITHRYHTAQGEVLALEDVNVAAPQGKFISIVGPSGCGKSSLLMILAGLLPPSEGERLLLGSARSGPQPRDLAVAFQDACLLPWRTSLDNVSFPLELRGVPKAERNTQGREALAKVGLESFADRYPRELSGGMRQRVAVARALIQKPAVLLMDEPFGALDEQTRMDMGEQLLTLWDQIRNTVVFVTHNLTEATYLSDEVIVMAAHPGRILERVTIDLPRPRSIEITETEQFIHLRNRLWRLIRSQE
ncbi:ABC transporter ATP-binding protein [Cryobacterium glaciale]|uniref:ABC transporter ATP-binding protein n=1 Tax=Cryobacterium glaciale TaxID=1259145 RepID=A0A4R8UX40_9MICO|nr:ABC transporter ATP-binding protein [Cryobacterium glaciale]TFB72119.1 ABC transporter ATP-binding protein [Cryobacterium glaciale]